MPRDEPDLWIRANQAGRFEGCHFAGGAQLDGRRSWLGDVDRSKPAGRIHAGICRRSSTTVLL